MTISSESDSDALSIVTAPPMTYTTLHAAVALQISKMARTSG